MINQPATENPPTTTLEPIEPDAAVRAQLLDVINNDTTHPGEIHRMLQQGLTPNDIQAELELHQRREKPPKALGKFRPSRFRYLEMPAMSLASCAMHLCTPQPDDLDRSDFANDQLCPLNWA